MSRETLKETHMSGNIIKALYWNKFGLFMYVPITETFFF